jgi:gluconolactonase
MTRGDSISPIWGSCSATGWRSAPSITRPRICVGALGEACGGVTLFHPSGVQEFLPVDHPSTTNICFGGADNRTAFITSGGSGRLLAADWPRPGLKLNYA